MSLKILNKIKKNKGNLVEKLQNIQNKQTKKIVLTYGTFDLLHIGHIKLLQRAKALGDYLVVGVSTDEFNNVKGKKSVYSFAERTDIIKSISYVDEVIPESAWDQKAEDIRKHNVNILVMGDDWTGKFDFLSTVKNDLQIVYLSRTQDISTTNLKTAISKIKVEKIAELKTAIQRIEKMLDNL